MRIWIAVAALGLSLAATAAAQAPSGLMARCVGAGDATSEQSVEACTALIKAGTAPPEEMATIYQSRAQAYSDLKRPDRALADANESLRLKPGDATVLFWRAGVLVDLGKDEQALADYAAALRADPANTEPLTRRGQIYLKAGALDPAVKEFEVLAARSTIDPPASALLARGLVQLKLGKPDAALAAFSLALKKEPRSPWEEATALYGSGIARRKKGDNSAGDAALARATALDKDVAGRFAKFGLSVN